MPRSVGFLKPDQEHVFCYVQSNRLVKVYIHFKAEIGTYRATQKREGR